MLEVLRVASLDDLVAEAVPAALRARQALDLPAALSESEVLAELRDLAGKNEVLRSFQGLGYSECVVPAAIQRHILENAGWYTAYTPYQPEISQGRLEALLNFQTVVSDLTGLPIANASLLDEGTAAAEAMTLCLRARRERGEGPVFFVSSLCHPQTIEVVRTRAAPLGIEVVSGDHERFTFTPAVFGALIQYPATDGRVLDYAPFCRRAKEAGSMVVAATDLLALTILRPPGEFGAEVAVGNSQRFGVPLGYGGPHAAFMATTGAQQRHLPGRLVGVSKDARGRPALRLALQTREQHIRRDKATSNICTAQVLLAVMASMYAVYHGPERLAATARRIRGLTLTLAGALRRAGFKLDEAEVFDTLTVRSGPRQGPAIVEAARALGMNLRVHPGAEVGVSLGETATLEDVASLVGAFTGGAAPRAADLPCPGSAALELPAPHGRTSSFLTHPVFSSYHSETEFMRYVHRLQAKDLSLTTSMIPLGSCTMKLNAAAEMLPVSWPGFAGLHPFAPPAQAAGYAVLMERLGRWLGAITGLEAVSLMPNSGAQGEYAGLLVIRAYHASRGERARAVCLIPESAHGTNPASAALAGMEVAVVACDAGGNIDVADLKKKADLHAGRLAALMVTYPSTHGVFEESIREICETVHRRGGQVYLDGANLNAMVGLLRPGDLGADVCHLNLHKTFCIPHGGGGPGMGPICAARHLAPFLPRHPLVPTGGAQGTGPVSSAPFGSPGILPISYAYIAMMGAAGLTRATEIAILNANYIAVRLQGHFEVLYRGSRGRVAHECILDARPFKDSAGVQVEDIAKRLMDYGFHAPTMSWPVAGTLMVEPTESESKDELDRFCEALIAIRGEIRDIEAGRMSRVDNPLKNAPHTMDVLAQEAWSHPYTREKAAFPAAWLRRHKFWPAVARIDQAYGDRHLVCSCPPVSAWAEAAETA
jgi:glycine dehydrogenase